MTDQDEAARIIHRLRYQYDARTPLPLRGTATVRPAIMARPGALSRAQLERLERCVRSEGIGEDRG